MGDILCSYFERLTKYRFNAISIKITTNYFFVCVELENMTLKFTKDYKRPRTGKRHLKK